MVTSLVYHSFARQWQIDSRVDPNRIAELRAAADTETDLDSAQQYGRVTQTGPPKQLVWMG